MFFLLKESEKLDCIRFNCFFVIWRNIVHFLDCAFVVRVLFDIDRDFGYYQFDYDMSTSNELRDA